MKKAIIIPIYLRLSRPEELSDSEGMRLAKRAIESLNILEDQGFTLVIPVALNLSEEDEEEALLEADRSLGEEVGHLRRWTVYPKAFLASLLLSLDYIGKWKWKREKECIANIRLFIHERMKVGWII